MTFQGRSYCSVHQVSFRRTVSATRTHRTPDPLSTLAEEGGAGKVFMLNAGAYDTMDACIMCVYPTESDIRAKSPFRCHPSPGRKNETGIRSSLANQHFKVTYTGHTYAGPWLRLRLSRLTSFQVHTLRQRLGKARMLWMRPSWLIPMFLSCASRSTLHIVCMGSSRVKTLLSMVCTR